MIEVLLWCPLELSPGQAGAGEATQWKLAQPLAWGVKVGAELWEPREGQVTWPSWSPWGPWVGPHHWGAISQGQVEVAGMACCSLSIPSSLAPESSMHRSQSTDTELWKQPYKHISRGRKKWGIGLTQDQHWGARDIGMKDRETVN